jgi:hypothetical protein
VDLFIEKDFARSIGRSANSAEYAFSPAPESGPGAGHVVVAYDRDRSRSVAITCAWRPTAGGYALEFFIPAAALEPARMEGGCTLGMNFILSKRGTAVERFYCERKPTGWESPIMWGAVQLQPAGEGTSQRKNDRSR